MIRASHRYMVRNDAARCSCGWTHVSAYRVVLHIHQENEIEEQELANRVLAPLLVAVIFVIVGIAAIAILASGHA